MVLQSGSHQACCSTNPAASINSEIRSGPLVANEHLLIARVRNPPCFAECATWLPNISTQRLLPCSSAGSVSEWIRRGRTMRYVMTMAVATLWPVVAAAHGGGLDANRCHTNRKTGDYHCHRAPSAVSARREQSPARSSSSESSGTGAYCNCTEARAAGAAPVRRVEAGYRSHLDRDVDGVGCE